MVPSIEFLNRNECLYGLRLHRAFRLDDILSVHDRAKDDGIHDFIDSASMMMHYGYTFIPCTRGKLKI